MKKVLPKIRVWEERFVQVYIYRLHAHTGRRIYFAMESGLRHRVWNEEYLFSGRSIGARWF